jgi:hypothetical protein
VVSDLTSARHPASKSAANVSFHTIFAFPRRSKPHHVNCSFLRFLFPQHYGELTGVARFAGVARFTCNIVIDSSVHIRTFSQTEGAERRRPTTSPAAGVATRPWSLDSVAAEETKRAVTVRLANWLKFTSVNANFYQMRQGRIWFRSYTSPSSSSSSSSFDRFRIFRLF